MDTWNDWVNGSNSAVIQAVDWLGVDAYPYFQTSMANGIDNGPQLFFDAYDATVGAAGGKDVWITETGWPVSGPVSGQAEASVENARFFWEKVACPSIGKINTYWYTLQDSFPTTPSPSFGVVGTTLSTTPLFDLSCPGSDTVTPPTGGKDVSSSSKAPASSTIVASSGSAAPTQGAGNGAGVGSGSGNASSTLIAVPSSGAGAGNGSTAIGGGVASPTGGAGAGSASPSGGAGSASPSGGAGGAGGGAIGGGSGSGSGSGSDGNGTVVSPAPTAGSTGGPATGAASTAGAGAGFAFGAAIMVAVAAF